MIRSPALERERTALDVHRETLRGGVLPQPSGAPRGTFLHGFLLPFSLIVATLRDRHLRAPYLKVVLLRAVAVAIVASFAFHGVKAEDEDHGHGPHVVIHKVKRTSGDGKGIHVHVPGVNIDLERDDGSKDKVEVLGADVPVVDVDAPKPEPPPPVGVVAKLRHGWKWIVALIALLSTLEGVAVFFSRRWDDWISFHAARLAAVKPEDETPKDPKLAIDLKWLVRKSKRRVRGYIVFGSGLPLLALLELVPTVGPWLFRGAATLWGWYWLGVFSASKSAHAWADEGSAPSPAIIRAYNDRVPAWLLPAKWYGRIWARLTEGLNPAAATFDRTPAPFLGLALARAILAFPLFYLFARPIVPVAAGRLVAEGDPQGRFGS